MDGDDLLTTREAYAAMYVYLQRVAKMTSSDELPALLGGMSVLPDGGTADPAAWSDWLNAIATVRAGGANLDLGLRPRET
jgi:hypothetical protein